MKKKAADWAPPRDLDPVRVLTRNKKIFKWSLISVAVLFVIGLLSPSSDSDSTSGSGDAKSDASVTPALGSDSATGSSTKSPTASQTPTEILRKSIVKEIGTKSNLEDTGGARIRSFSFKAGQVVIKMNGDENLSSGLTKSANRRLVLKAIKGLQKSAVSFDTAVISVYYPLVDRLGNTSVDMVLKYSFSATRVAAIKPDNVDTHLMDSGFADIATIVHPAFAW